MKKTSYKVVFNRLNKLNNDGRGLVQIECYLTGKRKYISTGIKIKPNQWDKKISRIKNNYSTYIKLNRLISQQLTNLENFEFSQLEKFGKFSLNQLKEIHIHNDSIDFISFCIQTLENNVNLQDSSKRHHRVTIRRLQRFRKKISFKDLDFKFINDFNAFLHSENIKINTIANQHKILKAYINQAIKQKLISYEDYPYRSFKIKKEKTDRVFLTLEEIKRVENVIFTDNTRHIEYVRDMFVFSCYTGLRFSDMQALTNKNILKQNDEYIIELRMEKTKDFIKLPVSLMFKGYAINIIKKYEEDFPEKFLFPRISNQKANLKLKVVSVLAQIDKNLTFHISRHTFGTNLAAATTDQFLIKKLMGHSDIKTSMIYIHTSQEHIRNKLKNTKWE